MIKIQTWYYLHRHIPPVAPDPATQPGAYLPKYLIAQDYLSSLLITSAVCLMHNPLRSQRRA